MKKRLCKKKHLCKFTEYGRQFVINRNLKDGFDEFLDAFLEEAIEANGCYCGGGGKEDKLDVVVELGRRSDDPDARLNRISAWLDARPDVENGELERSLTSGMGTTKISMTKSNNRVEQTPRNLG